MVAPNKIIVLNYTTQIWISDVYCLDGNNWFWLRLLPYILRDELTVEGVEAVEFRDTRVYVRRTSEAPRGLRHPRRLVPRPGDEEGLQNSEQRHGRHGGAPEAQDEGIRAGGGAGEQDGTAGTAERHLDTAHVLNSTIAQLNSTVAQLNAALAEARGEAARLAAENQRLRAQLEALNYTCAQLEGELNLCQSRLETLQAANATLTAQLTQLKAENSQLKAKAAELNESLAKLKDAYATQVAQLQSQLETWTRAAWIGAAVGAAAGAAATALALRRRK
jgi:regulator of replication initiation timing